ncbi:pantoate--beta-alanine ligase [Loktanella sp. SALINAS62]|uniref:pantoate--beta-alanine ligase n=1 Tax=Loktanella sp. SALINAS62 TaxID=2706124 RepID=UPI001B8CCA2B|nr:pantoate--beta-alanine ligase [Loktanella sp. SALINAS62]MBS1301247.1 pantoate--beta-alanine ligase [Loktanella sp. SALINAS62]
MLICNTVADMRAAVSDLRVPGSVGLVTTMGALHAGHMALVAAARADHPSVVATIFVNPTQFGDPADLDKYPRTEDTDLAMLRAAGVDAVFMPDVATMYPDGAETIVETTELAHVLHGAVRPGHFRGVATVVTKLFNIIGADAAYFGEKDYQQLAVIRRMVADLYTPVAVHGVTTVREPDGLAMSSRNMRLTPADRAAAPVLHQALTDAAAVLRAGGTVADARQAIHDRLATAPRAQLEGLDFVDAATFAPVDGAPRGTIGIMISAHFGDILLIDQKEIET